MRVFRGILFQLFFVMIWMASAHAQTSTEKETAPFMEIEAPTYDFQQVTEGDVVSHVFRVFNRGNAALEIKKVKPG